MSDGAKPHQPIEGGQYDEERQKQKYRISRVVFGEDDGLVRGMEQKAQRT
jgi:hypothetical protein